MKCAGCWFKVAHMVQYWKPGLLDLILSFGSRLLTFGCWFIQLQKTLPHCWLLTSQMFSTIYAFKAKSNHALGWVEVNDTWNKNRAFSCKSHGFMCLGSWVVFKNACDFHAFLKIYVRITCFIKNECENYIYFGHMSVE